MDAVEDGYVDHELFSLSSIKVCFIFLSSFGLEINIVEVDQLVFHS